MVTLRARPSQRDPDRLDRTTARPSRTCSLQQDHAVSPLTGMRASQHVRVFHDYDLTTLRKLHRLAAVLQRLGDEGRVPRHPQQPQLRTGGPQALRRRAGDARPDHRGEVDPRPRRGRLLPGQLGRRRRRALPRRRPQRGPRHAAPPAPAGGAPRRRTEPVARRLRRAQGDRAARPRRGLRGHRRRRASPTGSRPSAPTSTTTTRSCSSRSATGSPRPSPSGSTSGCARSSGATRPTSTSTTWGSSRSSTTASGPRPGYPACPEHTEKLDALGAARRRGATPASSSPSRWRCGPARRSAASTTRTRSRSTSSWVALGRDQVADYAERKGWTLAEAERWLSPNLGYDPED